MASIAFAVQKAVHAVLSAELASLQVPGMTAAGVSVLDHAPQGQPYPYVRFGRKLTTADNLLAEKMGRVQVSLTVFSDFRGQEQVDEILAAIEAVLDDAVLVLDAGTAVRCDLERSDTTLDADGVTYMGSALYAVLVTA